jgi:hypothetical protein
MGRDESAIKVQDKLEGYDVIRGSGGEAFSLPVCIYI